MTTPFLSLPSLPSLLLYILSQKLLLASIIAFIPPFSSLRLFLLSIPLIGNYYYFPHHANLVRSAWTGFIAGEALNGALEYVEKCLLSQWSFEDYGPSAEIRKRSRKEEGTNEKANAKNKKSVNESPVAKPNDTSWERLRFGLWVAFSARYIATPYQARKVPPYSIRNPAYTPSRARFLLSKAFLIAVCYLLIDFLAQGNQPEQNRVNFARERMPLFSRLGSVSAEEAITRLLTSTFFWFGGYLVIQMYYATWALLGVALRVDRPGLWRPLYGGFGEAYTVRGFWGLFWHQLMRKRLTKSARYFLYNILGIPRRQALASPAGRLFVKYAELFLTFLVSGLYHQAIETAQGLKWSESGSTRFFATMAVGIVLEDAVQWVFRTRNGIGREDSVWRKAVGYVWVLAIFAYATPFYAYPGLSRSTEAVDSQVVPMSVFGLLRKE